MKQMMTKVKVRQRSVYIDSLKAFAIITVIVGHCIQYGSGLKYLNERLFFSNPIFKFIYSFHMPLFMLLSGYLFADSVNKNDYILSLKAKFRQLIIPLFSWSFVTLFITLVKSSIGTVKQHITILWCIQTFIEAFFSGPWFLWAVWWCSLIVIISKRFFKNSIIIYILVFILTFITPDNYGMHMYKFMYPFL